MKLTQILTAGSLALLGSALGNESVLPTGFLDASSLMVRAETNVDLNWKVSLPASEVEELVELEPRDNPMGPPTIVAKEDIAFEVQMLGAEFAWQGDYVFSFGQYKYGDSPYYTFFRGYGDDAESLSQKSCDILKTGEELQFIFRGTANGFRSIPADSRIWLDRRWTGKAHARDNQDTPALILKNGDKLPKRNTDSSQTDIASFLSPYLDEKGETVKIGPKDLIILAELNRESGDAEADYQDFVILVTFAKAENSTCTRNWTGVKPPASPQTPRNPRNPRNPGSGPAAPGVPE